jgi:hypothetical protein
MNNGFTITNPDPSRLSAIAAKHGLKAIKNGMRLNRAYTPTNCRRIAESFTGKKFRARDYDAMIQAIDEKLNQDEQGPIPEVRVWSYPQQCFIPHIPCEGERRVRLDVHDSLDNYAVFEVECVHEDGSFDIASTQPLTDWRIDLS